MAITREIVSRILRRQVSTVDCMMKNVLANWRSLENRDCQHDIGYAGLFYISLASYLEHYIRRRITVRITAYLDIKMQIPVGEDKKIPDFEFGIIDCDVDGRKFQQVDFRDYNQIEIPITKEYLDKVDRMNRNSLFDTYNKLFGGRIEQVIDATLLEDWDALAVIRNSFAHGADIVASYDCMQNTMSKDTFCDTVSGRKMIEQSTGGLEDHALYVYVHRPSDASFLLISSKYHADALRGYPKSSRARRVRYFRYRAATGSTLTGDWLSYGLPTNFGEAESH